MKAIPESTSRNPLSKKVFQHPTGGVVHQREVAPLAAPVGEAESMTGQGGGEDLLRRNVSRRRRCSDRFDPTLRPPLQQPERHQEGVRFQAQEQAVPGGSGSPAGSTEPLQEGGHGARGVNLDDPVKVADVDAQLQRGGCHDDTVPGLGECLFGVAAFGRRQ